MTTAIGFNEVRAPVHGGAMVGPWTVDVEAGGLWYLEAAPSAAETFMGLCVGSVPPTSGDVLVLGERPGALSRFRRHRLLRRMGVVFQREGLISNLPLLDNLVVPLVFASGYTPRSAREAAGQAMEELGLNAFSGRRPDALTRETRIVAALARAALRRPELLIVEHLSAGLPDALAEHALNWCRERAHTMLVLVPGPSGVMERLADGRLVTLEGTKEEGLQA